MTKRITHSSRCISSVLNRKMKLLVVATVLVCGGLQAQTVVLPTITTPGAGTWTVPAGVASVTVQCWSGGGAGGSAELTAVAASTTTLRGGGGAGGSYASSTIAVTPGQVLNYYVGAGGTAPATGFANDATGDGQNTTFESTVVVALGGPGGGSKTASTNVSAGGAKGTAPTTGNTGSVVWYGGSGYQGSSSNANNSQGCGPGGGSAGSLGNGGNATSYTGGAGLAGPGGGVAGAGYRTSTGAGTAGGNPGAGGAGASIKMATAIQHQLGGKGGDGQIIISYTMIPTGSTVAITAPANKTVIAVGGSIELSATVALVDGRTFSSIVFKDGETTIGNGTDAGGGVYTITYNNIPAGKRTITAVLTDNVEPVTSASLIVYGGPVTTTGNKYAQSAITWSAGPWYDDPTDGQVVTPPAAGDNVFTQGYAVTIADDATCDNLTFTNAEGQIGIAADKTLTVRGQVNSSVVTSLDAFSSSNATSTLKLTGAALASPYLLATDNAATGMKPKNVVIETSTNTYDFGVTGATYTHGTGAFTVKGGTKLNIKSSMLMNNGANNHFVVDENAEVTTSNTIRWNSTIYSPTTKITVNGSLTCTNFVNAVAFIFGNNATLKTTKADVGSNQTQDGWWGYNATPTFGKPSSITMGTNTTIEFNRAGNQNINGIVPVTTPYSISYVNLKLSGSGTKTVWSNLIVSKSIDIAPEVSMVIPVGIVVVNTGSTIGTAPTPLGAIVNATSNDNAKGMVTATISATNEVTLIGTPLPGYMFVNWTEASTEISTAATLASFIPVDGTTRTLVANFVVDPSTSLATTTKANAFVTVVGKNLLLIGEVNAVEVFNAQGKLMQSQGKVTHVNGLNNGIYIVKMHTPQGVNVQKVSIR